MQFCKFFRAPGGGLDGSQTDRARRRRSEFRHPARRVFGRVAPIVAFERFDAAVRLANATEHGLVAYVYTRDLAKGFACAAEIEAGMIGLN